MKNWRIFRSRSILKGEQIPSSIVRVTLKETEPALSSTGLTQENYVNPAYLGKGTVTSISHMSFNGLWL
jgi:hypothetical protein